MSGLAPLSDPLAPQWLLPGQRLSPADRLIRELRALQRECEHAQRWMTASHWQHAADLAEAILRDDQAPDFDPTTR